MRVEGTCRCVKCGHQAVGWIDALTETCRACEIDHGKRWGHDTTPAEEGQQVQK